jgi:hypothetical protein
MSGEVLKKELHTINGSYATGTGSFHGERRPGRGVDYPTTSGAEVEGRVELYISAPPSGPSWPVLWRTLSLPLPTPLSLFWFTLITFPPYHLLSSA